eukprot:4364344-Pyramimonas_sp.AAC.1
MTVARSESAPRRSGGPRAAPRNLRQRLDGQDGPARVAERLPSARAAVLLGARPRPVVSFRSGVAA